MVGRLKLPPSTWTATELSPFQTNPRVGLGKGEEQARGAGWSHRFLAPPRPIRSNERDFRGSMELQGWIRRQKCRLGGLQQKPILEPKPKPSQTEPNNGHI